MSDATWKAIERAVCKMLGGHRLVTDGEGRGDCAGTYPYALEIKHRKEVPDWLKGALMQATVYAKHDELPLAVIHEERQPIKNSLVIIRLGDFADWFVGGTDEE